MKEQNWLQLTNHRYGTELTMGFFGTICDGNGKVIQFKDQL